MPNQKATDWSKLAAKIKRLQETLAQKVISADQFGSSGISEVCGFDASYGPETAFCSAVVVKSNIKPGSFEVVEVADNCFEEARPYVPGMFMLREGNPALDTLRKVNARFDVLLIDGHGILHPRRCGLASYVGVVLDKPTVGVAKSLLCGTVRDDRFIELGGKVLGFAAGEERKVYVSVGHRVSLETAISVVRNFTKRGERIPEPLRLADKRSKSLREMFKRIE